jgi:hypothetical protein
VWHEEHILNLLDLCEFTPTFGTLLSCKQLPRVRDQIKIKLYKILEISLHFLVEADWVFSSAFLSRTLQWPSCIGYRRDDIEWGSMVWSEGICFDFKTIFSALAC